MCDNILFITDRKPALISVRENFTRFARALWFQTVSTVYILIARSVTETRIFPVNCKIKSLANKSWFTVWSFGWLDCDTFWLILVEGDITLCKLYQTVPSFLREYLEMIVRDLLYIFRLKLKKNIVKYQNKNPVSNEHLKYAS